MNETLEQIALRVAETLGPRGRTYSPDHYIEFSRRLVAEIEKQQEPIAWMRTYSYDLNGDKQGNWPIDMHTSVAFVETKPDCEATPLYLHPIPTPEEVKDAARYRSIIEQLWNIIDDIDTYGDMAKSDDKLFRSLVENRQKDRWKTGITTDGYELNIQAAISAELGTQGEKK